MSGTEENSDVNSSTNAPNLDRGVMINELLCYATYYMHSTSREQLQKCVYRFYNYEEVAQAKKLLFDIYSPLIGEYPQRRSSPNRSELLAHVEDIINAIYQLDEENITFRFSAFNLSRIPFGNPNESDYMAADGFQIPKEHKKRQDREKRRREIIKGTAPHDKLKGGPMPNRDYFVYRVQKQTTEEDMTGYLQDKAITFVSVQKISNPDAMYSSFRIKVPVDVVNKVTDPNSWPEGISVRRFYVRVNKLEN